MKSQRAYLEHIRHCIARIDEDSSAGKNAVFASPTLQDAILRNLQVLCESTQRLDEDLKRGQPHIDWQAIAGLRNVLVHDYFSIDVEIVWRIVERDLPLLKAAVEELLNTASDPSS